MTYKRRGSCHCPIGLWEVKFDAEVRVLRWQKQSTWLLTGYYLGQRRFKVVMLTLGYSIGKARPASENMNRGTTS